MVDVKWNRAVRPALRSCVKPEVMNSVADVVRIIVFASAVISEE